MNKTEKGDMKKIYRQGDVILIQRKAKPKGGESAKDPRGLVLADGESSGHHHQVFGNGAKLFNYKSTTSRFLTIPSDGAEVRVVGAEVNGVPRHHPITLGKGTYEVRIQRSWDSERAASERVAD